MAKQCEIKSRCNWESPREHIGNLGNVDGNLMGPHWEHVGRRQKKTKDSTPPSPEPERKKS